MAKRDPQSTGTVNRAMVEKKGFKRAEAAIYLGVVAATIDRLRKRGPFASFDGTAPPDLFQRRPRPLPEGDNRDYLERY